MEYIQILPLPEEDKGQGFLCENMEGEILPVLLDMDRGYLVGREDETLLILHRHAEVIEDDSTLQESDH